MKFLVNKDHAAFFVGWILFLSTTVATPPKIPNTLHRRQGQNASLNFASAWQEFNCASEFAIITGVSAVWTIPTISLDPNEDSDTLNIAIGIDGWMDACGNPAIEIGVQMTVTDGDNGVTTSVAAYWAVFTDFPTTNTFFNDITIAVGDTVQAAVSVTKGSAPFFGFENLSNNQSGTAQASGIVDLCQQFAFFSVQDPINDDNSDTVPFPSFSNFNMQNCSISLGDGAERCVLNGGWTTYMENENGEILASANIQADNTQTDTIVQFVSNGSD